MRRAEFRTELDGLIKRAIPDLDYRVICAEAMASMARLLAGLPDADDRAAALEAIAQQTAGFVEMVRPLRESLDQIAAITRGGGDASGPGECST